MSLFAIPTFERAFSPAFGFGGVNEVINLDHVEMFYFKESVAGESSIMFVMASGNRISWCYGYGLHFECLNGAIRKDYEKIVALVGGGK